MAEKGVNARVVSMPCMEEFEKQTQSYKDKVLPKTVKARVCVEAGSPYSWYKYAGDYKIVGIKSSITNGGGFTQELTIERTKIVFPFILDASILDGDDVLS